MTEEEWNALVREAAAEGFPGADEALTALLVADAVVREEPLIPLYPGRVVDIVAPLPRAPLAPSEPEPTLEEEQPVETLDSSRDAMAERYLARHQGGTPPRGQRRRPTLRAWDEPEDLQYQDVGEEQPEKHGGPLQQNDGSVRMSQG